MVRRNLHVPHEIVCVTDDVVGIDDSIRIVPLWQDHGGIANPSFRVGPSCYRRLRAFAADAAEFLGERILSIDLDTVIVGDITPLVDRDEDFVIWGDTARNTAYNGGLWLLKAGTRTKVWETFDPVQSPRMTRAARILGSDQAWISYILGPKEKKFTRADGVYSFRNDLQQRGIKALPDNARVVMFHGRHDPWQSEVQATYPWVRKHWHADLQAA